MLWERDSTWLCLGVGTESSLVEEEMTLGTKLVFLLEWRKIKKRTFLCLHWGARIRNEEQNEDISYVQFKEYKERKEERESEAKIYCTSSRASSTKCKRLQRERVFWISKIQLNWGTSAFIVRVAIIESVEAALALRFCPRVCVHVCGLG